MGTDSLPYLEHLVLVVLKHTVKTTKCAVAKSMWRTKEVIICHQTIAGGVMNVLQLPEP